MTRWVEISFDCLPLRSVACFTPPVDASREEADLYRRLREAAQKHGIHNAYYLHGGKCVFHLTNHEQIGMLNFHFDGVVLTDEKDMSTQECDLEVVLVGDTCDWLVDLVVKWFAESVCRALKIEFDRFIAAGDLDKTVKRLERLQAESDAKGGYLGLGL
ncbi:MAG: hypothetical protein ABSG67_11465 [Thermoguttaceae bacterium]|jgi:hypothetical protein